MRTVMRSSSRQSGATALEFALIFPLLFAMLYGVVAYSYVFVLQESITYAAQQAAATAVNVSPAVAGGGYQEAVRTRVQAGAVASLSWLPDSQRARVLGANGEAVEVTFPVSAAGSLVAVRMVFDLQDLFPAMNLPFVGSFPPLPDSLITSATVVVGES